MRRRCGPNPRKKDRLYGGYANIEVCERWQSFANFVADMGERPSPSHSIDRIDGERGYEPGNCRWATPKEQAANRRPGRIAVLVTVDGTTYPSITAACAALGMSRDTVGHRIWRKGMSPLEALTAPVVRRKRHS
jgi:hypothetical protein